MITNRGVQILVVLILTVVVTVESFNNYKNYQVYSINVKNTSNPQWYKFFEGKSGIELLNYDRKFAKVLVAPEQKQELLATLETEKLQYNVVTETLSGSLNKAHIFRNHSTGQGYLNIMDNFYRHNEINDHLDSLVERYPGRAFVKTFGRTYQGRYLKTITITNGDKRANKNVILIDAAMHAREWITVSTALHIIDELLMQNDANADILQDYDWVIVPVLNADGYEYSHTDDRFWRRTRKPSGHEDCVGTDLNRNFDFEWGLEGGSSNDPCVDIFRGPSPFSEPESQVLRDIMLTYGDRLKFYLSLHSFGNFLLLPWGHTEDLPDAYEKMMDVAEAGALAIVHYNGTSYTYGSMNFILYPLSGDSIDYAHGALKIPNTIIMELPEGGITGFDPPVTEIEQTVKETWTGIRAMGLEVVKMFQ